MEKESFYHITTVLQWQKWIRNHYIIEYVVTPNVWNISYYWPRSRNEVS